RRAPNDSEERAAPSICVPGSRASADQPRRGYPGSCPAMVGRANDGAGQDPCSARPIRSGASAGTHAERARSPPDDAPRTAESGTWFRPQQHAPRRGSTPQLLSSAGALPTRVPSSMDNDSQPQPSSGQLFLGVFPSIMLPMFLAVVDQTIVATAL